jgi:hypothetical protein
MPQGKGTYGSKVGRPPKKKKIDPPNLKKKKVVKKKVVKKKVVKKKVVKKDLLPSEMERMVNAANKKVVAGGGKRMSLSQLRKAGKINF